MIGDGGAEARARLILTDRMPIDKLRMLVSLYEVSFVVLLGAALFAASSFFLVLFSLIVCGECEFTGPYLLMIFSLLYFVSHHLMEDDIKNLMILECAKYDR